MITVMILWSRSQGRTISNSSVDIDIATPPGGRLAPFNVYFALSCGRGCDNIQLLGDFDEKLLMHTLRQIHAN
ncbi:hypothetical protein BDR03DRAFT_652162 [Suillus americanus]|nr:hypothetical protein BDR03DRAFT_652162 [Suillus americanus]